jgi:hypothetical protein
MNKYVSVLPPPVEATYQDDAQHPYKFLILALFCITVTSKFFITCTVRSMYST